jgi:adenine-specific DNA-methyltransferase
MANKKTKTSESEVLSYRHSDKRKNNPEVGMVDPDTDPDQPKTKYSYDPHIDPSLQFDSKRFQIEKIIDDALASGNQDVMQQALLQLKRQQNPYLNWAGKAEKNSFDIDTVSLHVHERIDPASILSAVRKDLKKERPAKPQAPNAQLGLFNAPFENLPLRDAIDFYMHDRGWANRLIAGDSLLVMNSMIQKESMAGQVQMVFIDPPYGIKYGSNFQPFIDKRDVKDKKDQDLTQEPEMLKAFRDTWELGIHSYLSYLRDRLFLSRELLTDSGSIFIQISDENVHHVREICDEIFGVENFVSLITFRKKLMPLGAKTLEQMSDFLVWYAKDKTKIKYNHLYRDTKPKPNGVWSGIKENIFLRKINKDEKDNLARGDVDSEIFTTVSQWAPSYSEGNVFEFDFKGEKFIPNSGQCWVTSAEKMKRLYRANRLHKEGNFPRYVLFHKDFKFEKITSPWNDTAPAQDKKYVVQTNEDVLARCIHMTTEPGDLVLDPTCGSGTTAYVAEKLGRRWITCDSSRVALTLAKQRIMTASFDYYELRYPHEGLKGGFIYQKASRITLKTIANNLEIDDIYEKFKAEMDADLNDLAKELKSNGYSLFVEDGFRANNTLDFSIDTKIYEWELPNQIPKDWVARSVTNAYEKIVKTITSYQVAIDRSILSNADPEQLFDKPLIDKKKLRISGPFTLEAVPSPMVASMDEKGPAAEADQAIARSGESQRHHDWKDELIKTGIRGKNGQLLKLTDLETLPDVRYLHASGTILDTGERVVVSFGPEYSLLEQRQVEMAMREASDLFPRPKMILFCGFDFDSEAAKDIDSTKGILALRVKMNADLLTEDLKKQRSSNQSFWLMGQPDVSVIKNKDGLWQVEVNGFDYFDTVKGELISGGKRNIAAWMLDTDYDGRSVFPRQVFFPMAGAKDGWGKLRKEIKAELDESALSKFSGTVSIPFEAGDFKKIAVKIVDDRGIESLKVLDIEV